MKGLPCYCLSSGINQVTSAFERQNMVLIGHKENKFLLITTQLKRLLTLNSNKIWDVKVI